MKNSIIGIIFLLAVGTAGALHFRAKNMLEIKFVVGKNIVETAKQSNIPEFNVSNTNGLLHYQVMQLPPDVIAVYNRPGFEIRSAPVFSLNFWADRGRSKIDAVHAFQVKLDTEKITNHRAAQDLIESIIVQFRAGKWQRRISANCPAVTGRSAYLNVDGAIDSGGCALDPEFAVSHEDWMTLFATRQSFEWLGDGVFSKLSILYDDAASIPAYEIVLLFEDYKTTFAIDLENEKRRLELGDAKGWNSSATTARELLANQEKIKVLEAHAAKRGDKTLVRIKDPE